MEPEPLFEVEDIRDVPGGYDFEIDLRDENAPTGQPTSIGQVAFGHLFYRYRLPITYLAHNRGVRVTGILPADAPDPRAEQAEHLKLMPIPVMGVVPQPSLENTNTVGLGYGQDDRGYSDTTASVTYTLWRNPNDRSDPMNLADLDEQTRRAIEDVPPWPRPAWLVEQVERMRYPQLWEAVQTTWHRDSSERYSVSRVLVDHVNYILMNQYRHELGLRGNPWDQPAPTVTDLMVNGHVTVLVNGVDVPGAEVNTDPFVYGIGAGLAGGGVVTAVLPRAELKRIQIQFTTRR